MRHIAWFSSGIASAIAARILLKEQPQAQVVRCIVKNEHADNDRFASDVEKLYQAPITNIASAKYADCWQVWEERRYLNGPAGALCTVEMKKKVRQEFQRSDDVQIFGFTADEKDRAERFVENNPEVNARFPLIEKGYSKNDCFRQMDATGIEAPEMYKLGFNNANCIGCVKGGMGYWNKTKIVFPDVFDRMKELENDLGASCINGKFLRDLKPGDGRHEDLELPECGLFCNGYGT